MKIKHLLAEDLNQELSAASQKKNAAQTQMDNYLSKGGKRHAKSRLYVDAVIGSLAGAAKEQAVQQAMGGKKVDVNLVDFLNNAAIGGLNDRKVENLLRFIFKGIDHGEELVANEMDHWQRVKAKPSATKDLKYTSHGMGSDQDDLKHKKNQGQMHPDDMEKRGMGDIDKQKRTGTGQQVLTGVVSAIDDDQLTIDTPTGSFTGISTPLKIRMPDLKVGDKIQMKANVKSLPQGGEAGTYNQVRNAEPYKAGKGTTVQHGTRKITSPDDAFSPATKAGRRIK